MEKIGKFLKKLRKTVRRILRPIKKTAGTVATALLCIVLVAVFAGMATIDLAVANDHELDIKSSMMYRHEDFLDAIVMTEEGRVQLTPLISAHFPFKDYAAAYQALDENPDTMMKVIIDMES